MSILADRLCPCTACVPDVRSEARFDTTRLDPEPAPFGPAGDDHAAVMAYLVRQNAEIDNPLPVCRSCGYPSHPGDMDCFQPRKCTSCAMRQIDKLLYKIARKHGRKKALKLLKRLAK
jgi:hypothetical protein